MLSGVPVNAIKRSSPRCSYGIEEKGIENETMSNSTKAGNTLADLNVAVRLVDEAVDGFATLANH